MEIVGHGGAGDFFPGNSLSSLRKGMELGVDRIEVDVQIARDGELVLCHDNELVVGGEKRRVRELPLAVIRDSLDELLTLDEAIELTRASVPLMIDMKLHGYEREIADAIQRHAIGADTIVSSTWALSLRTVRDHAPAVRVALSTGHMATAVRRRHVNRGLSALLSLGSIGPSIAVARAIGAELLSVNYRICSDFFAASARAAGLEIYAWTVNHPRPIRMMIERDVNGIISNRPDLVNEQLDASSRTGIPD